MDVVVYGKATRFFVHDFFTFIFLLLVVKYPPLLLLLLLVFHLGWLPVAVDIVLLLVLLLLHQFQ